MTDKEWEDLDFPIWHRYEFYEDTYELYRSIAVSLDVGEDEIPCRLKDNTKYNVVTVYFKILESGKVEGPFDDKNGRKI